jgi:Flp pilus assembly protein TadG
MPGPGISIWRAALARASRLWSDRRGAQAVEFALIAPSLLLLVLGGMEFGRLLWTVSALHMSVEQAARCGAMGLCTTGTAPAYAAAVVPQLQFGSSTFTVSKPSCGFQVSATYTYTFIASGLFPVNPTLKALACFP